MNIILGYIVLIGIWSTTPLAIKWGATDVGFAGAIFWRILLSALLALAILKARGGRLFNQQKEWRVYSVAALGIAPNFLLVYWSSLWISSGLISVIFSTVPFVMGVLSYFYLGKNVFTRQRILALGCALVGLVVIFFDQLSLMGIQAIYGCMTMIVAVIVFAISGVWLQQLGGQVPVFQLTTGSLWFAMPVLILCWWLVDARPPWLMTSRAAWSIVYLGIIGSLFGFVLYYYLIRELSAFVVSTVGMVSPVFALLLGTLYAGETLSPQMIVGTVMVLLALALYHKPAFIRGSEPIR